MARRNCQLMIPDSTVLPAVMRDTVKYSHKLAGRVALTPLFLLATACASVPDMPPPRGLLDASAPASATAFAVDSPDPGEFPDAQWWTRFGDAQLNALIDEGLANSPSVDLAAARLAAADAQAMQAGAATGPGLVLDASLGGQSMSQNQGFPPGLIPGNLRSTGRLAGSFGYDLDLWGRNRAALRAARGEADAAGVDAAQARLALSTGIAATYARLAGQVALVDAARQALETATTTAQLTAGRVAAGLDNAGANAMAQSRVAEAEAALIAARQDERVARHALAALLGAGPDRGLAIAPPRLTVDADANLPANLPLDLVGRRPDLVSARLRAESAAALIGVAQADFYPSINLSAVAGLQSIGLADLLRGSSFFSNVGPAVRLPLFAQAGPEGRYRAARAGYDEAVAVYDQTLLDALRDVADALAAKRALTDQLRAAQTGVASAAQARRIAELRYREGLTSQLPLLVADQALIAARRTLAVLESQSVIADIALIRGLGGGFAARTTPATENARD